MAGVEGASVAALTAAQMYQVGIDFAPMGQHADEIVPFLAWLAERQPRIVLEIGTGQGALTRALCELASAGLVISIDEPEGDGGIGREAALLRNARLMVCSPKFVGVLGDSQAPGTVLQAQAALAFRGDADGIDVLFIDGDHRADMPARDFDAFRHLVRPGGVIAFHDINSRLAHPGVARIWTDIRQRFAESREFVGDHAWGGIGAVVV